MSFSNRIENMLSNTNAPGQYLRNNGVNQPVSWAPITGGSGITQINQIIATITQLYVPSPNAILIKVELVGGGGGGGGIGPKTANSLVNVAASGGGGGGYTSKIFQRNQLGQSITVTIGLGGTGAANGTVSPTAGGTTSFGLILSASGGGAGTSIPQNLTNLPLQPTSSGFGGVGSGGDINLQGQRGGYSGVTCPSVGATNNLYLYSGKGGDSPFSKGSRYTFISPPSSGVVAIPNDGIAGFNYGAGGSGASLFATSFATFGNVAGGNGANGVCIITEYIT